MNLTKSDKELITMSYKILNDRGVKLAHCFYSVLFEMEPLVKPLFNTDNSLLEKHFNELIHVAVQEINNFHELEPKLYELGRKHKAYDVTESQFDIVKSALLLSIEYELEGGFNMSIKNAWSKYIDNISRVMIKGLLE